MNLGIVAHIDAGKTSLSERLLHHAGVIDTIGRVDHGDTRTDSLALERQRGITIRSTVVSFEVDGVTVDLVDTPGHPDFIAEVERALSVLDAAVLVVSAVEGVQAQTRILMRTLRRLGIPTVVFVNKIDRTGARGAELLPELATRLGVPVVAMGEVADPGTASADWIPYTGAEPDFLTGALETLAEQDDRLLADFVAGRDPAPASIARALVEQTADCRAHPVYFGSAMTGAGVAALASGLVRWLPAAPDRSDEPIRGVVFKIERGTTGERLVYLRLFAGSLTVRQRVAVAGVPTRVTGLRVFESGQTRRARSLTAGRIGLVTGWDRARVGDTVGTAAPDRPGYAAFAPPTLETIVECVDPGHRLSAHRALSALADQDPLIGLRQDTGRGELRLTLYGEIQKEVIAATVAAETGVTLRFRESTTICVERVVGVGEDCEVIATDDNPFLATVGLRVEPAPIGTGVRFDLGIEPGALPTAFIHAVEETVSSTLTQGLRGWQVPDCRVTLVRSGYWARQSHSHGSFDPSMSSTAGDFRQLTPLVLMAALRRAGTVVCEPVHRFEVEAPADTIGPVLSLLTGLRAVPDPPAGLGDRVVLTGEVPADAVHRLGSRLPGVTRGEGVLVTEFGCHRPVTGPVPDRPRTDRNPLNRREYLLRLTRRVTS